MALMLFRKERRVPKQTEIEDLASKIEPALAKAILLAFEKLGEGLDAGKIIAALEKGDMGAVMALLDAGEFEHQFGPAKNTLQEAAKGGGMLGESQVMRLTGVSFRFNTLNPALIRWMQGYELDLIKQINSTTREAVRDQLLTGLNSGINPKQMAVNIKTITGLTSSQAKAVLNFRKELESFHLKNTAGGWKLGGKIDRVNGTQVFKPDGDGNPKDGILNRRLRDFRYDPQLIKAMESGVPLKPEQIDKMVKAYVRKYLAYRARNIARTESLRATNVGVADAWRQAIESGKVQEQQVRRKWIVARDERTCETCGPIPRMNPALGVEMDKPFQSPKGPVMMPPLHPSCRCTVFIRQYEPEQLKEQ